MLNILVDTNTVRNRLSVLGFSFVGVADVPDLHIDTSVYTTDYPITADYTAVYHKDSRQLDDDVCYAMGTEYYEHLQENVGKQYYAYFVYRRIEEVQYDANGSCKYSCPDSSIHVPLATVYYPKNKRFYSMCYCGTLEWLHMEMKEELVVQNDTVIIVRK